MKKRINYSTGTKWEKEAGYSRAVKINNFIFVSGTTAMDKNDIVGKNDISKQTEFIFQKIELSLNELGASLEDIVQTRMYVKNIEHFDKVAAIHGRIFSTIKPASTLVEINNLVHPELLVEIEAIAFID